jgi:acyl-CoA reductase-like NAD-dependent aldehyde dehydrogenase
MYKLIAGGRELDSGSSFEVLNPFDSSVIDQVASAEPSHVEAALAKADGARRKVAGLTRGERARILTGVSEKLLESKQDLALILAREVGKTLKEARGEVARAANTFAFAADEAKRLAGEIIPFDAVPEGHSRRGFSLKVPLGTILAITPYNFPLNLAAHKIAPAMASGNPFILKPASVTPLADVILGKLILEAGFPPEAVSVLPGPGSSVGLQLVRDPRPRMVTFTGSVEVGKEIAGQAGFKKIGMELGSNSGVIVAESADTEFASKRIVQGAFALAGQVCISVQRVAVHKRLFDVLAAKVTALTGRLRIGNQLDESTDMGPMISERDAQRLEEWIDEATKAGAEVLAGGHRQGSLYEPTVLAGVSSQARVWKEEAFGPVVCINAYDTFDQAVQAINQSRYGLQAGVFTNSVEEAFKAIELLDVGGVIVNDFPTYRVDQMPYGGAKDSGIGREGLKYAIQEMTEEKLVCFNFWRPD